jgi:GNAT superfamily N-acetyltransferase
MSSSLGTKLIPGMWKYNRTMLGQVTQNTNAKVRFCSKTHPSGGSMITITSPTTKAQFKAYYALRYRVLREPGGHPKGTEKDDYEPISEHFMAVSETGEIVGVAKLFEKSAGVGHLSHMVVAPEQQHKGIGRMLMEQVEKRAREKGYTTLGTMSRLTATAFFEKHGFKIAELPTLHLGTIHLVWMEKDITQ